MVFLHSTALWLRVLMSGVLIASTSTQHHSSRSRGCHLTVEDLNLSAPVATNSIVVFTYVLLVE